MKKILYPITFVLIMISTAITINIPNRRPDYIKQIPQLDDKISAQNSASDIIYAEHWNDKFQALKDKSILLFGYFNESPESNVVFYSGMPITTEIINAKFNAYTNSISTANPSIEIPEILQTQFLAEETITSQKVNQKFISLSNYIDTVFFSLKNKWNNDFSIVHSKANNVLGFVSQREEFNLLFNNSDINKLMLNQKFNIKINSYLEELSFLDSELEIPNELSEPIDINSAVNVLVYDNKIEMLKNLIDTVNINRYNQLNNNFNDKMNNALLLFGYLPSKPNLDIVFNQNNTNFNSINDKFNAFSQSLQEIDSNALIPISLQQNFSSNESITNLKINQKFIGLQEAINSILPLATKLNNKFSQSKSRADNMFGTIPNRVSFSQTFATNAPVLNSLVNQKFQDFISALRELDPLVIIPSVLSTNFGDNEYLTNEKITARFDSLNLMMDNVVNLPDKKVLTGTTWTISAGSVNEFRDIEIEVGANVEIVGTGLTVIESKRNFKLNGKIFGRTTSLNQQKTYNGNNYVDAKAQQPAGVSSGNPNGTNGKHGVPLIIKAVNLSGSGEIDLSGENGGQGSAATYINGCPSGSRAVNVDAACNSAGAPNLNYACLKNEYYFSPDCPSPTNACSLWEGTDPSFTSTKICNTSKAFAMNNFKENSKEMVADIFSIIKKAQAGGGGGGIGSVCLVTDCPVDWFVNVFMGYSNNRGGGGAGGNGGNLWLLKRNDTSSIIIKQNSGLGGTLHPNGTGGTVGSPGLNGILSNILF